MEGVSVFDLVAILVASYGLVFLLGVYAGRAAAWREGLQAVFAAPEKPKKDREVPNHVHREDRRPPPEREARNLNGAGPTRVVGRRPSRRDREED